MEPTADAVVNSELENSEITAADVAEESLIEDVSIDGMCGVY